MFLKIGGSFVDRLEDEQGEFVQFEYVKSIDQNICPLNLYGGKEPSGENIYTMCKQGPIYVRACQALKVWVLSECFESDGMSENSNGASTGTEEEGNTLSTSSTSNRHCTGEKRCKQSKLCFTCQVNDHVKKNRKKNDRKGRTPVSPSLQHHLYWPIHVKNN